MTNRERLSKLSNEELAKEILAFANCGVKDYVDLQGWLGSTDEEYPLKGTPASFKDTDGTVKTGTLVGDKNLFGMPYVTLLVKQDGLHQFQQFSVPENRLVKE